MPISGIGKSRVYLWDRDTSLATISESTDWGEGNLMLIEELEGYLVGVSISEIGRIKKRITFRYSSGANTAKKYAEFVIPATGVAGLSSVRQKVDNRIYFTMFMTVDGVIRRGIWSIGISSAGKFTISNERTPNNDTAPGADACAGFILIGDYMFISYTGADFNYALSKTNDAENYTATSAYESPVKNGGDSDIVKKLIGASAMFEPLSANAQVALLYKKDAETGWTRLFVYTTDNSLSHGAVNIESDSNAVTVTIASPGVFTLAAHGLIAGQVIKLRTTGALPTGLTAGVEYYVLAANLTSSTFKLGLTAGGAAINTSGTQSGVHTIDRTYPLTQGKEMKFRLESMGGAVITGFKYKMETVDKELY